jgi:hypothetical protein
MERAEERARELAIAFDRLRRPLDLRPQPSRPRYRIGAGFPVYLARRERRGDIHAAMWVWWFWRYHSAISSRVANQTSSNDLA